MMTTDWYNSVNQSMGSQKIRDINEYVESVDRSKLYKSSIDKFYKSMRDILGVAKEPQFLKDNCILGPLLFVGVVSCTENYFREIMSDTIQICPICQAASATQNISLGSVIWHSGCNVEKGSFENISFASAEAIVKTSGKYLKFKIDQTGLAYSALKEYDKICELRHGIVHSNAIIAGKNAIKLGIKSDEKVVKVNIGYKQLQECAAICTSLVISYNSELFVLIAKRWAIDWVKLPLWDSKNDNKNFNKIWKIFYSEIDNNNGLISNNMSMVRCRNYVKKAFNR